MWNWMDRSSATGERELVWLFRGLCFVYCSLAMICDGKIVTMFIGESYYWVLSLVHSAAEFQVIASFLALLNTILSSSYLIHAWKFLIILSISPFSSL